jgi:hypothetical protein
LLAQLSGNATDFVDGTNNCQPLQPVIWSARLRSFNAVGNPNFEVDQRQVGNGFTIGAATGIDRWFTAKLGGTMAASAQQGAGPILLPGTNFVLSNGFWRITLTTAQATLAASDLLYIYQNIEGPQLRELIGDVHSVSLLVRSTVAGLKFGLSIRSPSPYYSLAKLCTIPTANSWTLIPLANLPIWTPSATWPLTPAVAGYTFMIGLAVGSTYMAPANDVWQTGNFVGAVGQDNFASKPVNSTFDIAFVQHEPGNQCTTPIDKPFRQNYDECLRYFAKSYNYASALGSSTGNASVCWTVPVGFLGTAIGHAPFPKPLAKAVTATIYAAAGAINNVFDTTSGLNRTVVSVNSTERHISMLGLGTNSGAGNLIQFNYTADTNW